MILGKLLKEKRKENNMSLREVAKFVGIGTPQALHAIEIGKNNLRPIHFKRMSVYLNVELNELITACVNDFQAEIESFISKIHRK